MQTEYNYFQYLFLLLQNDVQQWLLAYLKHLTLLLWRLQKYMFLLHRPHLLCKKRHILKILVRPELMQRVNPGRDFARYEEA